jgi:hypothetical protein
MNDTNTASHQPWTAGDSDSSIEKLPHGSCNTI